MVAPNPDQPSLLAIRDYYQPFVTLAIHGQENKWWMLYVYLLMNSILVLSCSTVLVGQGSSLVRDVILSVFALAGTFIDLCWIIMAVDYVKASNLYGDIARDSETGLPVGMRKPLTERSGQRMDKNPMGTTQFVSYAMPIVFILVYVALVAATWVA